MSERLPIGGTGSPAAGPVTLEGKDIVLVEDEALIVMDLADEIERAGARVVAECATVGEALGAIATAFFEKKESMRDTLSLCRWRFDRGAQ